MNRVCLVAALALASGGFLWADFSYEQTTNITGGSIMAMMKVVGVFSKQAREPVRATMHIKGNRMAHISSASTQIIDLDKETITEINHQKKSYSVVTFAQMAEALRQAEAKAQKGSEQAKFDVKGSVKETGQTKQFSGLNAREYVMTLEMEGTDPETGKTGAMTVISDMWVAPQAGYEEVRAFYQRMGEKLNWTPGGGMFSQGGSGMAKGMASLYKEAAKLDGVPVYQVIRMGPKLDPSQQPAAGEAPAPAAQPKAQPQEQPERSSIGGALGRLGGGRLGGLGGLGRRKKAEEPPAQPAAEGAPAQQRAPAGAPGLLMEATTELTGFSAAPVDASKFEVPSGFKQVESEMLKMMRR